MATAFPNARGQFSVQFRLPGKRPTIYLGKVSKRFAEEFAGRVEQLIAVSQFGDAIETKTRVWLSELPPKFRAKLAKEGLIEGEGANSVASLCTYCIAQADVGKSTMQKYRDAEANLLAHFGADRLIQSITPGDADEFARWLSKHGKRPKGGPLAPTTVEKRMEQVKQYFATAVRKKWLGENPFEGAVQYAPAPTDRQFFVSREMADKMIAEADPEMALIIALARYGGLRIPSEIWPLQPDWINLETETLQVLAPKTKRFAHKRWRFVPLFPEIRTRLLDAFERAPEGAKHLTHLRPGDITDTALRGRLEALCIRAGYLPYPKLWQNLRSSRETELVDQGFPMHVVCAWLGNSPKVAIRHYCQVTKEHIQRAIQGRDSALADTRPIEQRALSESLSSPLTSPNQSLGDD